MTSSYVIGCDLGTQSSKGVLVRDDGQVVAVASAGLDVAFPRANWAEQDPDEWTAAVAQVVAALAADADGPVTHLAVDAQVDGVVATDARLRPLHAAVIWMDRRATEQTVALEKAVGEQSIFSTTGLNCDATHGAPKMMWLRDHLAESPRWFLPPLSSVTAWLTGALAQDEANASSSMLWDVTARTWSDDVLDAAGIDPEALPEVRESTAELGRVRADLAADLGLAPGTVVVTGTGDDHAAAVGARATRPGVVADVSGTAEPIGATSTRPLFDDGRLVETHAHAVPGAWFVENPGFVSGGSTLWLARLLGIDQADVFVLAAASPPGAKGLVFIPALSGAMAPRWNDHARGSFTGLSMDHGREDLCRAVLEGCCFALRDNVDRLDALGLADHALHVTGGGARSELWLQMKADVTGREARSVATHGAPLGAACLAAVAAGWYPDVPAAADALVELREGACLPDPGLAGLYDAAYRRYRDAFDALEPTYR